jgi:taurine dioxygenase
LPGRRHSDPHVWLVHLSRGAEHAAGAALLIFFSLTRARRGGFRFCPRARARAGEAKRIICAQETGRRFVEGLPEVYIVSNVKVNGEPIGSLGDGEAVWHTDMSYLDVPPKASMLYALEVPPTGGNTSFCTMYGIYDALPAKLKDRIAGFRIKHDGTYNSGGYVRQGIASTDDPVTSPGAVHPLVCTHPVTGRRMLYLGRRRNAYLVGLELAESEALLDELWIFVDRPEFAWEHVWRVGDLVLWDNRCTMHRRDAFDPYSRRIMYRTQVKGEHRPV